MMNKMNKMGCMGILFAAALMSSCSSSNDDPTPAPNPNPGTDVVYKWTTDGGLKACICHVHRAEIQSVSIIFLSVQKYDLFLKFPNKLRKSLSKKEYYS